MKTLKFVLFALTVVVVGISAARAQGPEANKKLIKAGFDRWAKGEGSFFDLLADDVQWTITGSTPLSKIYTSKKQLLDEVIDPLNRRLAKRIKPTVRALYAEGDVVIALIDGEAVAIDNKAYNMSYAWFMELHEGKIVKVTAFLDGIRFSDIMQRLSGAQ